MMPGLKAALWHLLVSWPTSSQLSCSTAARVHAREEQPHTLTSLLFFFLTFCAPMSMSELSDCIWMSCFHSVWYYETGFEFLKHVFCIDNLSPFHLAQLLYATIDVIFYMAVNSERRETCKCYLSDHADYTDCLSHNVFRDLLFKSSESEILMLCGVLLSLKIMKSFLYTHCDLDLAEHQNSL